MAKSKSKAPQTDPATEAFEGGHRLVYWHPIFAPLMERAYLERRNTNDGKNNGVPREGWAVVRSDGVIRVHPTRRATPDEWAYVIAHCLLHLAWNHIKPDESPTWNTACDCVVARFLQDIEFGTPPQDMLPEGTALPAFPGRDELTIARAFEMDGVPPWARTLGTARGTLDWEWTPPVTNVWHAPPDWGQLFSKGLTEALTHAVRVASGDLDADRPRTLAQKAKAWFITSYPLLGALASTFEIVEDRLLCGQIGIPVARTGAFI